MYRICGGGPANGTPDKHSSSYHFLCLQIQAVLTNLKDAHDTKVSIFLPGQTIPREESYLSIIFARLGYMKNGTFLIKDRQSWSPV